MKKALQDARFNPTEIAARVFPALDRHHALKSLNRELRKSAPAPEYAAPLRNELGQLHHRLNGARLLLGGPTAQAAARQMLTDPRLTLRPFAMLLFPEVLKPQAGTRTTRILKGTAEAFTPAQLSLLATAFAELQSKLATALDLHPPAPAE